MASLGTTMIQYFSPTKNDDDMMDIEETGGEEVVEFSNALPGAHRAQINSKRACMYGIRDEDGHKTKTVKVLLKKKDLMHRDQMAKKRGVQSPRKVVMDSPEKSSPAEKSPKNEDV
jgi:hypothetical protein